ncbi:MAG: hypothetical protein GY780_06945 [bacterium]|nr:hypothetical protein [bacterium]
MGDNKETKVATSPEEAVEMLKNGTGTGCFIAGGTEIGKRGQSFDFAVKINEAGLTGIAATNQGDILIGATTTIQDCSESEVLDSFAGGIVSKVAARNCLQSALGPASVGGNICLAQSSAEMAPVLLVLDAVCFVVDVDCQESLPLSEFFAGPMQTVLGDRLLAGFALPHDMAGWRCSVAEIFSPDAQTDLVQVAIAAEIEERKLIQIRIAVAGAAPIPMRSQLAEEQLSGLALAKIDDDLIEDVAVITAGECESFDESIGLSEERRDLVRDLTRNLIKEIFAD